MLKPILNLRINLLTVVLGISILGNTIVAYPQGCLGTTGSGPTGGAISTSPGYKCANLDFANFNAGDPTAGAEIKITAGHVFAGDVVSFIVNWGDGTGDPVAPTLVGADWEITGVKHLFPVSGPNVSCEYTPSITLLVNGTVCTSNFGSSPTFVRWNVDNQLSGELRLTTKNPPITDTYLVCQGTSGKVVFKDRSRLNCGPTESTPDNDGQRWRRFTYGTTNTITSSTGVTVGGVVRAYPYQSVPIANTPPSNAPIFSTETAEIIVPDDAQAGEEFVVTMEYWNECNPYPASPPVTQTARILIVAQPTASIAQDVTECGAITTTDGFYVSGVPGSAIVTWYANDVSSGSDEPGGVLKSSTDPFVLFTEGISPDVSVPGVYKLWASYHITTGTMCESIMVPVTITNLAPTVTATTGIDQNICDQLTSLSLGANTPTSGTYSWSIKTQPASSIVNFSASAVDPSATATVNIPGVYEFTWTVVDGICTVTDDIKVVYDRKPTAPNPTAYSTQTCNSSVMLNATAVDKNGTGQWSSVSPVMIVPINTAATTVSNIGLGTTVVTWTISSQFGGCPTQTADYTIVRDPLPNANNSVPPLCEDADGSGKVSNVVLAAYSDAITGIPGSNNRTVQWATDINITSLVTTYTITNNLKLYVRVSDATTHCYKDREVVFTVYSLPTLVNQTVGYCETSMGSNQSPDIDLATDFNTKVTNNNAALLVKRWFDNSTGTPVQLMAGQVASYSYTGSASLIVEVQNLVTGCINEATVNLNIITRPVNNPILLSNGSLAPAVLKVCASEDIVVLHLDPKLNPGSTYAWSIPSQFEVVGGGLTEFYVLLRFKTAQSSLPITVQEFKNSNCGGNFQTINVVVEAPAVSGPIVTGDLQVCTNQEGATYTVQTPTPGASYSWQVPNDVFIIGDKTASTIHVLWGTTDGVVRAQEITSGGCTSALSTPFSVHVNSRPVVNSIFPQVCADDLATVSSIQNLPTLEPLISGAGGVSYTWFEDTDHTSQITSTLTNYSVTSSTRLDVVVSDGLCDNTATVSFTVSPFYPGVIGGTQSVCLGSDGGALTNLSSPVSGVAGSYLFQWQSSPDDFATLASITDIPLATDIAYDPDVINVTTYFRRKVSIGTCLPQTTSSVKVTALALPTGDFSYPPQICSNDADAKLNFAFTTNGPFKFDYNDDKGNAKTGVMGSDFTSIAIPGLTENTTYTLTKVEDVNKCVSTFNTSHTVQVLKVNADFSIDPPLTQCSGESFHFHWNVDADVTYTWLWGNGESTVINANTLSGDQEQIHAFTNASPSTVFNYPVQLFAVADNGTLVCEAKPVTKNITVNPTVQAAISGKQVVCSGEQIQFNNLSVGASTSEWYIDNSLVATTTGNDPFNHTFNNTTGLNPAIYKLRYKGMNAYCPGEATLDVQVYRAVNADFINVQTKVFSGYATMKFTNRSAVDLTDPSVLYTWSFGEPNDAMPASYSGPNVDSYVNYNSPGLKYVSLKATNTAKAECVAEKLVQVNIVKPSLSGNFKVTPLAGCLPIELTIINSIVGGDAFDWSLLEKDRGEVATSSGFEPTFRIASPGEYKIDLTVTLDGNPYYYQSKDIKVFDLPVIGFLPSPSIVNIPDIPVHIINHTSGANNYLWDFGDNTTSTDVQPVHAYLQEGEYIITLIASYDHGDFDVNDDNTLVNVTCSNTGTQGVRAITGGSSLVPNAFTPSRNGPGSASADSQSNDYFLPITEGVVEFEMEVFDRWGSLIFITKDKTLGWDGYDRNGKALAAGVYVYKLTMTLSNGQRTTQIGDVTLLR